jgi:hypothetical protein
MKSTSRKVFKSPTPEPRNPEDVLAELEALRVDEVNGGFIGYGTTHMWTHISGWHKLPYFKHLLLPHNIDVMHT